MYGTPGCLLSGPSFHKGTPAIACPTILAHFAPRAFVARSEEVIPPYYREIYSISCTKSQSTTNIANIHLMNEL